VQELKCPSCGYLNPDIRELGYTLPRTCGKCPHVWRLQDVMSPQKRNEFAHLLTPAALWDMYVEDSEPPNY